MDAEYLKNMVHALNTVSLTALQSGQEIGRRESAAALGLILREYDLCLAASQDMPQRLALAIEAARRFA